MRYLIIGGGISGLYAAYLINQTFGTSDIMIIEKDDRLGGRIETFYVDGDYPIELGAGGVIESQKNIIPIIKQLGLKLDGHRHESNRYYLDLETVPTKEYDPAVSQTVSQIVPTIYRSGKKTALLDTDFYQILDTLFDRLNDSEFYQMALSYDLYHLIGKFYGFEKANQLMYFFGYHGDFYKQNAVQGLEMFQKDFAKGTVFRTVVGGMSDIIRTIAKKLVEKRIEIRLNCECLDLLEEDGKLLCKTAKEEISADHIILAMPKMALMKINYLNKIDHLLNSVAHKQLLRIYVFFPLVNGKVWFDQMPATITTRTIINQIYPQDPKNGLMMLYCDSENAKAWHYFNKKGILEREMMFHLTKIFNQHTIPNPTRIYVSYHDSATHIWKPSTEPKKLYDKVIHPFPDKEIFIVGEAYSLNQQWGEGAIQTVKRMVKMLKEKN